MTAATVVAAPTVLPRSGVGVWFVETAASDVGPGAGRSAAQRALRGLLAAYGVRLRARPRSCRLCPAAHGKPGVADAFEYSVSHSGAYAVVATSVGRPVGVDLERSRRWPDAPAWLDRLDARERAALTGPDTRSERALLDCWTRHEATGKALGCGLAHGLAALGRAGRGEVPGVRVRAFGVAPLHGVSCSVAVAGGSAPTTVHLGRWTATGPVVDDVREAT